MSLAPAERRALDKIEDSLRRSDPQLSRMMRRFTVPVTRGGLVVMARSPGRTKRLLLLIFILAAIALFVLMAMYGSTGTLPCGYSGNPAVTASSTPNSSCK
jgi:hypothetical protein